MILVNSMSKLFQIIYKLKTILLVSFAFFLKAETQFSNVETKPTNGITTAEIYVTEAEGVGRLT